MVNRSKTPSSGHKQKQAERGILPNVLFEILNLIHNIFWHFRKWNFHIFCSFRNNKQKPGNTVLQLDNLFLNLVHRLGVDMLSAAGTTIENWTYTYIAGHYHRETHVNNIFDEGNSHQTSSSLQDIDRFFGCFECIFFLEWHKLGRSFRYSFWMRLGKFKFNSLFIEKVNTYKVVCCFFLHLLHLSTPRPAGKTARVVVGIHNQVLVWCWTPCHTQRTCYVSYPNEPGTRKAVKVSCHSVGTYLPPMDYTLTPCDFYHLHEAASRLSKVSMYISVAHSDSARAPVVTLSLSHLIRQWQSLSSLRRRDHP